jgi:hypothetical protein
MELSQGYPQDAGFFKRLGLLDWLYACMLMTGALFALVKYGTHMDSYEKGVLLFAAPAFAWLGWHWKPMRWLLPLIALLALLGIAQYAGELEMAKKRFLLKWFLSSQSAILWMAVLFFLSTLFYWISLASRSESAAAIGSKLCWSAVILGLTGMLAILCAAVQRTAQISASIIV